MGAVQIKSIRLVFFFFSDLVVGTYLLTYLVPLKFPLTALYRCALYFFFHRLLREFFSSGFTFGDAYWFRLKRIDPTEELLDKVLGSR